MACTISARPHGAEGAGKLLRDWGAKRGRAFGANRLDADSAQPRQNVDFSKPRRLNVHATHPGAELHNINANWNGAGSQGQI